VIKKLQNKEEDKAQIWVIVPSGKRKPLWELSLFDLIENCLELEA
jgi:hypothetical protein